MRLQNARAMRAASLETRSDVAPPPAVALRTEVFARHYYALFNERRLDDAERLVDPQAIFTHPVVREHLIGRAGYRELTRRWLEAFPDAQVRITAVYIGIDHEQIARTEWIGEGTHLGLLELPGFPPIPPTGRCACLPMCETLRIRNGLVVTSRLEFDPNELHRVLGI